MGYDIEQDIINQFLRGDIDHREAINTLEEELGLSYDDAYQRLNSSNEIMKYDRKLILQALNIEIADAYWISPAGMIRPVVESHIDDIVNCPADFGLDDGYVSDMFAKYGESIRTEKHARDEIVLRLFKDGWIRIRYYSGVNFFSIELGALTKRNREYLFEWAWKTLEVCPERSASKITVVAHLTNNRYEFTLLGLTERALLSKVEQILPVSDFLVPIKSSAHFTDKFHVIDMSYKLGSLQSRKRKKSKYYNRDVILSTIQIEDSDAYWISPGGMIRAVGTTHISEVLNNPVEFGLTEMMVKDTYKKYKEKYRTEGKARDEILLNILKRGWVRIRYNRARDCYNVSVFTLGKKAKEYLFEWAYKMIEMKSERKYSEVYIIAYSSGHDYNYSMEELTGEALISKLDQGMKVVFYLIPLNSGVEGNSFLDFIVSARLERKLDER